VDRRTPHARIARERRTIEAMIRLYCRDQHGSAARGEPLCPDCAELLAYAGQRLAKCPFQENKPTCARCTVHCYQAARREQIRTVMRYAGPRMLRHHPWLAIRHLLDGLRRKPVR
jgi:Nitrous oxide-stimulated promoter